jgi:hypothetical protein
MRAGKYDITCEQGTTFIRTLAVLQPDLENDPTGETFEIMDLTGYTARMQVRRTLESTSKLFELTTENGSLDVTFQDQSNIIRIYLPSEVTASVDTSGVYDLELVNQGGEVSRLVEGQFIVVPEVTR